MGLLQLIDMRIGDRFSVQLPIPNLIDLLVAEDKRREPWDPDSKPAEYLRPLKTILFLTARYGGYTRAMENTSQLFHDVGGLIETGQLLQGIEIHGTHASEFNCSANLRPQTSLDGRMQPSKRQMLELLRAQPPGTKVILLMHNVGLYPLILVARCALG